MQVCDKIAYKTHQEAQNAVKGSNRRNKRSLHSYKCKECKQYHLASNGKKKWIKNLRHKEIEFSTIKIPMPKKIKPRPPQQTLELATEKLLSKDMIYKLKQLFDYESPTDQGAIIIA